MARNLRAGLLLGAGLLLTACTGGGGEPPADQSGAPQIEQAVPEQYRAEAAAFAEMRRIDACGLHDPEAAKKVTGDQGDELMPSHSGLQECTLRLHKSEFESTWTLYLTVGDRFDAAARKDAAPTDINGIEVFVREDERGCSLSRPLDDKHAIELRASPGGSSKEAPPKPPCTVLKEYVGELGPVWKDLPKRGSGRTTPELKLAALDPCSVAAATLDLFGEGAVLEPSEPYVCTAKPTKPAAAPKKDKTAGANEARVTLMMDDDPSALIKPGDQAARETTIADHKVVIYQKRNGCTAYIVWDPETKVVVDNRDEDAPPAVQQISVDLPTCEAAQQAAEKILAKVK